MAPMNATKTMLTTKPAFITPKASQTRSFVVSAILGRRAPRPSRAGSSGERRTGCRPMSDGRSTADMSAMTRPSSSKSSVRRLEATGLR